MRKINKIISLSLTTLLLTYSLIACSSDTQQNDLEDAEGESYNDPNFSSVSKEEIRKEEDYITTGTEPSDSEVTESIEEATEPESSEEETDIPDKETEDTIEDKEAPEESEPTVSETDGITYIDGILVVNKTYALPTDYNPGVDATANAAFEDMAAAAYSDGVSLYIISGFRSYDYQLGLYQRYVNRDGKAEADRYSARAGHSEHQTGLAFDLNSLDQSFGETQAGIWLAEHCHEYGFIIRYPKDKESVTGYMYEPWHVRYLGVDAATAVYESGLCLEEYLGITSEYAD